MTTELTVHNPGTLMTQATDVAGVCGEIVKRTARFIQGRKYVQVEGWQSIAAAYGCVASSTKVERIEGGVRAIGELHRVSDGALIATAEGFVGEDEATWFGGEMRGKTLPKRNDFAIRAMAQTRAISRVCRSAFAFVVVLIDSNLSTTPAEEMGGGFDDDDRPAKRGKTIEHESTAAQASGSASAGPSPLDGSHPAPAGPVETRDATLTRLCKIAGYPITKLISKMDGAHPDEWASEDYLEAVNFLQVRIEKLGDRLQA